MLTAETKPSHALRGTISCSARRGDHPDFGHSPPLPAACREAPFGSTGGIFVQFVHSVRCLCLPRAGLRRRLFPRRAGRWTASAPPKAAAADQSAAYRSTSPDAVAPESTTNIQKPSADSSSPPPRTRHSSAPHAAASAIINRAPTGSCSTPTKSESVNCVHSINPNRYAAILTAAPYSALRQTGALFRSIRSPPPYPRPTLCEGAKK